MRFLGRVTNKRVISIVLAVLVSFVAIFAKPSTSYSQTINVKRGNYTMTSNIQGKRMQVRATAYANDPITSTGTKPRPYHTLAVDPKVIPYGTRVFIPEFNKVFVAEDCGSAIKGNRIDIYMESEAKCRQWGIRNITIIILD